MEAGFRNGIQSEQGGNAELFIWAVNRATNPHCIYPLLFATDSSFPPFLYIYIGLNEYIREAQLAHIQIRALMCMQLQMQNTVFLTQSDPTWPQQSWPCVTFALGQARKSLYDAFCPKSTRLKPPANHLNQNHKVQKRLVVQQDTTGQCKGPAVTLYLANTLSLLASLTPK